MGNCLADQLAKHAHTNPVRMHAFEDPIKRGPAWLQVPFGDTVSDADNLQERALASAEASYQGALIANPKSNAHMRIRAAEHHASGVGLLQMVNGAFWGARLISDWDISLALKVRYGTLMTNAKRAQFYPEHDDKCPLCQSSRDTIGHRLGACTHPSIHSQVCARHGHAVHEVASAVRAGIFGDCYMLCDAECHDRYRSMPTSMLPVSMQSSRPDLVLVQGLPALASRRMAHVRGDPGVCIHLVEVTFSGDFNLHDRLPDKQAQHARLLENLVAFGWRDVRLHIFVVGHTGIMLASNAAVLQELGVGSGCMKILAGLAVASLRKSAAILRCFPTSGTEGLHATHSVNPSSPPLTDPDPQASAQPPPPPRATRNARLRRSWHDAFQMDVAGAARVSRRRTGPASGDFLGALGVPGSGSSAAMAAALTYSGPTGSASASVAPPSSLLATPQPRALRSRASVPPVLPPPVLPMHGLRPSRISHNLAASASTMRPRARRTLTRIDPTRVSRSRNAVQALSSLTTHSGALNVGTRRSAPHSATRSGRIVRRRLVFDPGG